MEILMLVAYHKYIDTIFFFFTNEISEYYVEISVIEIIQPWSNVGKLAWTSGGPQKKKEKMVLLNLIAIEPYWI